MSITATSTVGTTVHTYSTAGADLIKLWAANTSSAAVLLTVEWGSATAAKNIVVTVPAYSGAVCIADRRTLTGGTVAAFAATTAVINCWGEVWNAA